MALFRIAARVVILAAVCIGSMPAQSVRVGTFHSPSIVVAFYRSPQWAGTLKAKNAELQAAKKTNDTAKVKELEAWGGAQQELAHRQLAGEAPLTNILEILRPSFQEIAAKAQVDIIASDVLYAAPAVQKVDVTGQLLDWLKADRQTREMIAQLRNGPPPK